MIAKYKDNTLGILYYLNSLLGAIMQTPFAPAPPGWNEKYATRCGVFEFDNLGCGAGSRTRPGRL